MARGIDPFLGTDFAMGGNPQGGPPGQGPPGGPPEGPPPPEVPQLQHPTLTNDPAKNAEIMQDYLSTLNKWLRGTDVSFTDKEGKVYSIPGGQLDPKDKEVIDQIQAEVTFWRGEASRQDAARLGREERGQAETSALARANISAGATLGAAGISAGASQFSAEEATRRQGLAQEFQAGESTLTRAANIEQTTLANRLAGEREQAQRGFEAEQKALDREIQRIQLGINQGTLNLNTALGQLEKWLEAQKYTLPEGAEYVPGFQPGGAVQEGARLAGVGYNPANYRANTVPFNPSELVRQTMAR